VKIAIIGGAVANKYLNGGAVWTRINWALGIRKLGFKVYFLEQIERAHCVDSSGAVTTFENCRNRVFFKKVMKDAGLQDTSALIYANGEQIDGMTRQDLENLAENADLLINITGHLRLPLFMNAHVCKVYIDLDPGFTQFWHLAGMLDAQFARHDHFFTIGEAIGTPACAIPTAGIGWHITRQPVVLEHWPVTLSDKPDRFTTVACWRDTYGPVEYRGKTYGLKLHQFRRFIELPESIPQICEIALDIHPDERGDLELLHRHGWVITDPVIQVPDPDKFREYVQDSGAEFSVAKGIYTDTNSGWFSDRTVRYLASGKPALVQDTGFSKVYPVGEGLLAFTTMEEAIAGAQNISRNYREHCRSARLLAETWFDSDKVLGDLVETIDISP